MDHKLIKEKNMHQLVNILQKNPPRLGHKTIGIVFPDRRNRKYSCYTDLLKAREVFLRHALKAGRNTRSSALSLSSSDFSMREYWTFPTQRQTELALLVVALHHLAWITTLGISTRWMTLKCAILSQLVK